MTLQDMQNMLLSQLQQPGITTVGSAPNFSAVPNPPYGADRLNFYLNRAYLRLMNDVAELELKVVSSTLTSTANTFSYNIPVAGAPNPALVLRVSYQPVGLTYNYEFQQGVNFLSWDQYQMQTGYGYYQQLSFGTQPRVCTVSVDRTQLWFYPGSAQSGDTITIQYAPLPTAGTTTPLLVNSTDVPQIPDDCCDAIIYWALYLLWINAREQQMSQYMRSQYEEELKRIKQVYLKRGKGDTFGIVFPDYPLPIGMEP